MTIKMKIKKIGIYKMKAQKILMMLKTIIIKINLTIIIIIII